MALTPHDLQPILEGPRLRLRPLRSSDFDPLYAAASDPLIWEQHPERDRYKLDVFRNYFEGALASKGALVVIDRESNKIIGSSRYSGFDHQGRVEIGYTFLTRDFWGRGFNREMKHLMLDHAFQFVDRVLFLIGEQNLRSRRAIEKLGASLIDRKERQSRDGQQHFTTIYEIQRSRWVELDSNNKEL
jgi:RimJ/RimL family protein N-acetyltransferase